MNPYCINTFILLVLCSLVIPLNSAVPPAKKTSPRSKRQPLTPPSAAIDTPTSSEKKLYWSSNHAGMFSQLLQTKLMYDYAHRYQRTLFLDTISSYHYGSNVSVDVCSFFNFKTPSVQCGPIPEGVRCSAKLPASLMESGEDICFDGPFLYNLNGAKSMREGVVGATTLDLPYSIQENKLTSLSDFSKDLLSSSPKGPFTVAHWRRGDQLVKRCDTDQDTSVNCENAAAFIKKVRQYSQDKIVYVATNEPQDSKEMEVIRRAGFKTLSNVVTISNSSSNVGGGGIAAGQQRQQRYNSLDALSVLGVEYSLMMRADTYLAWGISEIDDVVEYERMKQGKTHCTAFEPFTPVHGNVTFCLTLKQPDSLRQQRPGSRPVHTKTTTMEGAVVQTALAQKQTALGGEGDKKQQQQQPKGIREVAPTGVAPVTTAHIQSEALLKTRKNRLPPTAAATTVIAPEETTNDISAGDAADAADAAVAPKSPIVVRVIPPSLSATSTSYKAETKMAALVQRPQEGFTLTKTAFSTQSRLLFVAGLEGTGHHAVKAMFTVCSKVGLCEPDHIIAQACQQFDPHSRVVTGLFSGAGKDEMADVATIEARMKVLASMNGNHLYLVGLSYTAGAGMMSYPNFDGKHKSMDNPDVSTLAMIAESVGLDFRVLVLQRSAEEIISSTLKRGFGGVLGIQGEPKILIESANALFSQLSLLDKKFFQCVQYKQLGALNPQQKDVLLDFLHPVNLKGKIDAMLKEVSYNSTSTSHRKKPTNTETLDPLNAKYQTMHLANRLALIDGLCKQ